MRESCQLVGKTHAAVVSAIKEGVTTAKLDDIAETFIRDHDAVPAFKGYGGFPATLCISVNEEVVHGIPGDRVLKNGDVISIDCGAEKNGFFGDSAYTYCLGEVPEEVMQLLTVTKASLYKGIENAVVGRRLGDISFAVQDYTESHGYGVVRDLVGHGVGKSLHEKPEVPNFGRRGAGIKLKDGLVIAIEPMINMGTRNVVQMEDGWTIVTKDRKFSAHFEHTVAVKPQKADILTTFEFLEDAIKSNPELSEIR